MSDQVNLCAHCGLEPFEGDEYPEPFTGWVCFVCGAQIRGFDDAKMTPTTETVTYDGFGAPIVRDGQVRG